jgi:glycerol-3-phosphate acyltransferase PlsY
MNALLLLVVWLVLSVPFAVIVGRAMRDGDYR